MRPRMYGSRLRKWCRTSTWPSCSGGVSDATRRKLVVLASPCGRLSSRIWRFLGMAVSWFLVGADHVERLGAPGADRQPRHVLEGTRGMAARAARRVVDGRFAEGHGGRAVDQPALGHEPAARRLHERGLQLDRDHAHLLFHAARG